MRARRLAAALLLGSAAGLAPAGESQAQSLASRVAAAPEGQVRFRFASRPEVCGGRGMISIGSSSWGGGAMMMGDGSSREQCERGPVHVLVGRADGAVIEVETAVGATAPASAAGVTDLGAVPAREAADYLLGLAAKLDGRLGRDAILPAALADSADVAAALTAIGRDRDRPRETRRSALSWLARMAVTPAAARRAADALVAIARDAEDHAAVRQQAMQSLARLEHAAGVPVLTGLARAGGDAWLAREATEALARSGDPRAREHLRALVAQSDAPEALVAVAVRGLAREYATPKDATLLRDAYARLESERVRQSIVQSIAELGGGENARWLLGVARRTDERPSLRRTALHAASRAGIPMAELARLWDGADAPLRESLLSLYAESGERAAVDRLLAVARSEEDRTLRRRAIAHLSRVDDPRAKALLAEIATDR